MDALHATFQSGDLSGFIHGTDTHLHNEWHSAIQISGACGSPPDLTQGACKAAHDHFHGRLDALHLNAHKAFGVPH